MKDSELFCPRCAREYRKDFYESKTLVDSIFTKSDGDKETEGHFATAKTPDYSPKKRKKTAKLGSSIGLIILSLVVLAILPPLAPIVILIIISRLANKKGK